MDTTPSINTNKHEANLDLLKTNLERLSVRMKEAVEKQHTVISGCYASQKMSAGNLIRYLALRSEDIRTVQDELHFAGLSSLASSESHILSQLQAIQERLGLQIPADEIADCDFYSARALISERSKTLFGAKKDESIPFIMVTFDTEFANNYKLVKKLLKAGMNVARINCAHDDMETWENMIELIRAASEKTGIPCKIYMDLPGPKLRTLILGKGRSDGKVKIKLGQEILFAEEDSSYDEKAIVIGSNEPHIVKKLKVGDRVMFDDGLIETIVISNSDEVATLKVMRISAKKPQIKNDKGINVPDSALDLPPLNELDHSYIPFICEHADLIGYSFVRDTAGINHLQQMLASQDKKPKIILKIETTQAVKNFPSLLLQGMKDDVFGVMIARGDLAVEIGFERMSEIQEEITWICEAAHVPVIWATQVLDTLNKTGIATRSEITDASHSAVAECVMINKGDYIINVLTTLIDILQRTGKHHVKKRYTFRQLQMASNYFLTS